MRKLFWQMMVSLDGYGEGPNRELDWHVVDADFGRYVTGMLASIDAIVLGRVTYELFAAYWPTATNPEAARMNELAKIVASRTLARVDWRNSRLIDGDVAAEIARLKREPGKDLAVFGSAHLASYLVQHGLVDEYRIFVAPVLLGAGKPFAQGLLARTRLRLTRTQALQSGTVLLCYEPG